MRGIIGTTRFGGNSSIKREDCPVCGQFTLITRVFSGGYVVPIVCGSSQCTDKIEEESK